MRMPSESTVMPVRSTVGGVPLQIAARPMLVTDASSVANAIEELQDLDAALAAQADGIAEGGRIHGARGLTGPVPPGTVRRALPPCAGWRGRRPRRGQARRPGYAPMADRNRRYAAAAARVRVAGVRAPVVRGRGRAGATMPPLAARCRGRADPAVAHSTGRSPAQEGCCAASVRCRHRVRPVVAGANPVAR
ncbi:hypothetical protein G6F65_010209 [Rhizopus arrhizus]|nr:hypothetical protein G6F65_010209 [Rhizopus arrhizus]KAG1393560.1 hypothetical protein G6F59_014337 [Rhizopus arrhizus]